MSEENEGSGAEPRPMETGHGVFTLSSSQVNGGQPVAWVCQADDASVDNHSPNADYTESWVYLAGVPPQHYLTPSQSQAVDYQFTWVGSGTPAMANDASVLAQWVMDNRAPNLHNWPYVENTGLTLDTHQVSRHWTQPGDPGYPTINQSS